MNKLFLILFAICYLPFAAVAQKITVFNSSGANGRIVTMSGGATIATDGTVTLGNISLSSGVTGILPGANGGTGVANTSKTITLGASLTTTGTSATTLALPSSGTPTYTFPAASQTLASLAGTETLSNKTLTTPVIGAATGTSLSVTGYLMSNNSGAAAVSVGGLVGSATTIGALYVGVPTGSLASNNYTIAGDAFTTYINSPFAIDFRLATTLYAKLDPSEFLVNVPVRTMGMRLPYTAKTTTYAITINDYTVDCTSGTFTVTLPSAVGIIGQVFAIRNSGAGTITVATTSAQTINGTTPVALTAGVVLMYQSTGANWITIN